MNILVTFIILLTIVSPVLALTPTPAKDCQIGLKLVTPREACYPINSDILTPTSTNIPDTFRFAVYNCYDGSIGYVSSPDQKCLSLSQLTALATIACQNKSSCQPIVMPTVKLVYPNGAETLTQGNTYTITWQAGSLQNAPQLSTTLYLYKLVNGQKQAVGAISYDAVTKTGLNSYNWTINNNNMYLYIDPSPSQYIIEVLLRNPNNNGYAIYAQDESDNPITIISSISTPTSIPNANGIFNSSDANQDGITDLMDFSIWKEEYLSGVKNKADFNQDGKTDIMDFGIWKQAFIEYSPN